MMPLTVNVALAQSEYVMTDSANTSVKISRLGRVGFGLGLLSALCPFVPFLTRCPFNILFSLWISSVLLAVAAVICCHFALARIKKSPKQLAGKRLTVSGLILGYLMLGLAALVVYGVHEFNKFFPEFESADRIQYELHYYSVFAQYWHIDRQRQQSLIPLW